MAFNTSYFDSRLYSPRELAARVGAQARTLRQARSLRQTDLAQAAGVTVATIGRFEQTGKVGFLIVVQIATALGAEFDLAGLFRQPIPRRIDDIFAEKKQLRRRVRRRKGGSYKPR